MTRKQALNEIASLYNGDISKCTSVGSEYLLRKKNSTIDKIFYTYNFLIVTLYKNNARLKDVIKIHLINNTIYFDLKNTRNYELCGLLKEVIE
jgi:hypothetical protein